MRAVVVSAEIRSIVQWTDASMAPFPSSLGLVLRSLLHTSARGEEVSIGAILDATGEIGLIQADVAAEGKGKHEMDPLMRANWGVALSSRQRAILVPLEEVDAHHYDSII